ncbi:MAG: MBL fold metallo-hydrolase [Oscillospiraceae bacterium]|nr:MBL fold metallo-hydrolase [Oscillospiraceae bacterium]
MRIYPFFSSSSGNCTYVGNSDEGILIDCGVSAARVKAALESRGIALQAVKGLFITHEHTDHIKGLKVFTKSTGIPVYSRGATLDRLLDAGLLCSASHSVEPGVPVKAGSFCVTAVKTFHDAVSPCCYRIDTDKVSCAVCTDLGTVTEDVLDALSGVKAALIESNYDMGMLSRGPYPRELKERIASYDGHLENSQCAELAVKLVKAGAERLILGHLSQHNNDPVLAERETETALMRAGFERDVHYMLMAALPQESRYFSF